MSNLFYPYNASECFKFKSISFPLDESLLVDDMCADGLNHELSKSSRTPYVLTTKWMSLTTKEIMFKNVHSID